MNLSWNKDPGFDFFSDDDVLPGGAFSVFVDLFELSKATTVELGVGYWGATTDLHDSPLPTVAYGELASNSVELAAGLRYHPWRLLGAFARVAGGASWVGSQLTFASDAPVPSAPRTSSVGNTSLQNPDELEVRLPYASVSGGLVVMSPLKRLSSSRTLFNALGVGLSVEGGYRFSGSMELSLPAAEATGGSEDGEERHIRQVETPLGSLDWRGAFLNAGLFVRL